jgi:two-component system sensor histidine kinase CpxA
MFSKQNNKYWLEDGQGNYLAGDFGRTWPGGSEEFVKLASDIGGATIWSDSSRDAGRYLVVSPVELYDKPAQLYAEYSVPESSDFSRFMYKEMIIVCLVTGVLAMWAAYAVCRPLRQLQQELSNITGELPLKRVTVKGDDEIADVAGAVNRLVDGLNRYIIGMRQLLSNISHELRSPLARMSISAELISDGLSACSDSRGARSPEEQAALERSTRLASKHLGMLREELVHMDRLIGKTLLLSTVDVRDPGSLTDTVSFSDLCMDACRRYQLTLEQEHIGFEYSIEPYLELCGDQTLLLQMISNLLDNAVKYTENPALPVRLNLARSSSNALLRVENACDALPDDAAERIFEPFYRHEQSTGQGVGLGLSLVKRIVELHGGKVGASCKGGVIRISVKLPLKRGIVV